LKRAWLFHSSIVRHSLAFHPLRIWWRWARESNPRDLSVLPAFKAGSSANRTPSRGGGRVWENVVAACKPCNGKKGNKTPREARMVPRAKPWVPTRKVVLREHAVRLGVEKWMPYFAGTPGPLSRSSDLRA
jgi:hypothetical protein